MDELFGKDFFDAGRTDPGYFQSYGLEKYRGLKDIAAVVVRRYRPKKLLDVGCAKGFMVLGFREFGVEAYGIDVSAYALANAPADVAPYLYKVNIEGDPFSFPMKRLTC